MNCNFLGLFINLSVLLISFSLIHADSDEEQAKDLRMYGSIAGQDIFVSEEDFVQSRWSPKEAPLVSRELLAEKARELAIAGVGDVAVELYAIHWVEIAENRWIARFRFRYLVSGEKVGEESAYKGYDVFLLPNAGTVDLRESKSNIDSLDSEEQTGCLGISGP